MKKNLILLGVLIGLLTLTYFVYEVGEHEEKIKEVQKEQLFQPEELGEIKSLKNNVVTLIKEGQHFYTQEPKLLVDQRKVEHVFEILTGVRSIRTLRENELSPEQMTKMFPKTKYKLIFEFERGRLEFLFGNKLQFDQTFYLQLTWSPADGPKEIKTVIARDVSLEKGMYSKENHHLSDRKYNRLLTIIFLDAEFFYESRLFPELSEGFFRQVSVTSRSNRPFTLNFDSQKTTPAPFSEELAYQNEKIKNFQRELSKLEAARVAPSSLNVSSQNSSAQLVVTVKHEDSKERQIDLKVYRSSEDKDIFWVKRGDEEQTFVFEERPGVFYSHVQDFWDKTPKLNLQSDFVISFGEQGPRFPILASNLPSSGEESPIASLVEYFSKEADAIDIESAWESSESETWMQLNSQKSPDEVFHVQRVKNELHLKDETRGLIYRYFERPEEWDDKSIKSFLSGVKGQ